MSWGDVATAFHSTGIPNIEVYFEASPPMMAFARTPWFVKSFLGLDFMQHSVLKWHASNEPNWLYEHVVPRAGPDGPGDAIQAGVKLGF